MSFNPRGKSAIEELLRSSWTHSEAEAHEGSSCRGHTSRHVARLLAARAPGHMLHRPLLCPTTAPSHGLNSQLSPQTEGTEAGVSKATEDPTALSCYWLLLSQH